MCLWGRKPKKLKEALKKDCRAEEKVELETAEVSENNDKKFDDTLHKASLTRSLTEMLV